jgi:hypothetical protein
MDLVGTTSQCWAPANPDPSHPKRLQLRDNWGARLAAWGRGPLVPIPTELESGVSLEDFSDWSMCVEAGWDAAQHRDSEERPQEYCDKPGYRDGYRVTVAERGDEGDSSWYADDRCGQGRYDLCCRQAESDLAGGRPKSAGDG